MDNKKWLVSISAFSDTFRPCKKQWHNCSLGCIYEGLAWTSALPFPLVAFQIPIPIRNIDFKPESLKCSRTRVFEELPAAVTGVLESFTASSTQGPLTRDLGWGARRRLSACQMWALSQEHRWLKANSSVQKAGYRLQLGSEPRRIISPLDLEVRINSSGWQEHSRFSGYGGFFHIICHLGTVNWRRPESQACAFKVSLDSCCHLQALDTESI